MEEQKKKKAEYMKAYRAKNKIPITKPEITEIPLDLEPTKYKPKKAKKVEIKDITANTYISKLRAFHKRMTGLPLSDNIISAIKGEDFDKDSIKTEFKYLYDRIEEIKEKEVKSIPNLCKVFTKFVGFVRLIKILTPFKKALDDAYEVRRNETVIPEENLISFDKQTVLKNAIDKLKDNDEKLLYLLMTLIPTRRLDDFRTMTIGKGEGNYCENGVMFIKDTNTKNKKPINIKMPNEVIDIIPESGYMLGLEYDQPSLSRKFMKITEKVYGKKISANEMRRMYMTNLNQAGASFTERKVVAVELGHSVVEGIKYAMKVS
jgi:hypothetical protein